MTVKKNISQKKKQALILLSGGVDSAACLDFLCSNSFKTSALFIDYGQPARKQEERAAKKISSYYNVSFKKVTTAGIPINKEGFIVGRNLFLYSIALMEARFDHGIISAGIHKGTAYSDCSAKFLDKVQGIYDMYVDGRIRLFTPFSDWVKADIWHYCQEKDVPVNLTYSCERGGVKPCGKCLSCIDMINLYASKNK